MAPIPPGGTAEIRRGSGDQVIFELIERRAPKAVRRPVTQQTSNGTADPRSAPLTFDCLGKVMAFSASPSVPKGADCRQFYRAVFSHPFVSVLPVFSLTRIARRIPTPSRRQQKSSRPLSNASSSSHPPCASALDRFESRMMAFMVRRIDVDQSLNHGTMTR